MQDIAKGVGVPLSFFKKDPIAPDASSLHFRSYRTAPKRSRVRAERTFTELFDVAHHLMDWAKQPQSALPFVHAGDDGLVDIEELALRTRANLGLRPDQPIGHLTRTLERNSVPVAPIVFADLNGDEAAVAVGHFGISGHLEGSGRALITYFPSPGDRQRFTLAHEIGHVVMHDDSTDKNVAESEADRFAGAFLVPAEAVQSRISNDSTLRDFAVLKAEWGVSIQALIMRCHHLELLDEDRRVSLYKQISTRGWRRNEPVNVRHEEPALLGTLIAHKFRASDNVYTEAGPVLGLPPIQLRALMPPPGKPGNRDEQTKAEVHDIRSRR